MMADISDVTRFLAQTVAGIVYPNGTSQPSIINMDVRIYEGWPQPAQLDLDVAGKILVNGVPQPRSGGQVANVSVYPMPGATATPYQILDNTYLIIAPNYGLTLATATDGTITFTGQPVTGEYVTLICDRANVFSRTAVDTATLIAGLASDAIPKYPGTTYDATHLRVPAQFAMSVRQGSIGTLGKVTHRQTHGVMISVWAPNHIIRTALGAAIDNVIKRSLIVTMPDTSEAKIVYSHTNVSDSLEATTIYRRDLIFDVEYATVWEFPGYVITTVDVTIANEYGLQPVIQSAPVPAIV